TSHRGLCLSTLLCAAWQPVHRAVRLRGQTWSGADHPNSASIPAHAAVLGRVGLVAVPHVVLPAAGGSSVGQSHALCGPGHARRGTELYGVVARLRSAAGRVAVVRATPRLKDATH